ncbi:MAG: HAD family hydrolase, partial [Candidatus Woesebacteria bacterium]|nr:HAD family hydrolase [Candidatus Woesebacteria bacterium]
KIYTTPLIMLEGAEEGLKFINKVKIPIGIVTHAGEEWTYKKYNWLNLNRFLNWDDVFIVDQNKHKTSESWAQAIQYFNLNINNCAVVGDSPRSDINPVWKLGVRQCFLVDDPKQWSIHNELVDSGVKKISNLNQIVESVLN